MVRWGGPRPPWGDRGGEPQTIECWYLPNRTFLFAIPARLVGDADGLTLVAHNGTKVFHSEWDQLRVGEEAEFGWTVLARGEGRATRIMFSNPRRPTIAAVLIALSALLALIRSLPATPWTS